MLKLILVLSVALISPLLTTKQTSYTPRIEQPKQLVTPPADYDVAYRSAVHAEDTDLNYYYYKFGATNIVSEGYMVKYGRSTDGAFYNYTSGALGGTLLGFNDAVDNTGSAISPINVRIKMTFLHSDTTWASGGGGAYYNPRLRIGSSEYVGEIAGKWQLEIENVTAYDYALYIDCTSQDTEGLKPYYEVSATYYDPVLKRSIVLNTNCYYETLTGFFIPPRHKVTISTTMTEYPVYFDAFYLKNKGMSFSGTTYYNSGFAVGYDSGYAEGNSLGYSSGLIVGGSGAYEEGYLEGSTDSFLAGFDDWIVPAIIIVLFLGGFISIWAMKKRNEA